MMPMTRPQGRLEPVDWEFSWTCNSRGASSALAGTKPTGSSSSSSSAAVKIHKFQLDCKTDHLLFNSTDDVRGRGKTFFCTHHLCLQSFQLDFQATKTVARAPQQPHRHQKHGSCLVGRELGSPLRHFHFQHMLQKDCTDWLAICPGGIFLDAGLQWSLTSLCAVHLTYQIQWEPNSDPTHIPHFFLPSAAAAAAATTGLQPKDNLHKWTMEEEIITSIPLHTPQPSYLDAGLQLHFCQCPWHQTEPPSPTTLASPRTVHMLALQSNPAPCINILWHQPAHQSGQLRIYIPCTNKAWVCRLYFTTFYNDSKVWGGTCFRNNATFTSFTSVVHVIRQKYDFCTWPQMLLVPLCCHSYSYNKKIDPPHETSQIHGNSTYIWPSPNNTKQQKTAQHNKTRLQNYYHGHFDHSGSRQQVPWCTYLYMFMSKNRMVKTQMSMRLQRKLLHNDTLKVPGCVSLVKCWLTMYSQNHHRT